MTKLHSFREKKPIRQHPLDHCFLLCNLQPEPSTPCYYQSASSLNRPSCSANYLSGVGTYSISYFRSFSLLLILVTLALTKLAPDFRRHPSGTSLFPPRTAQSPSWAPARATEPTNPCTPLGISGRQGEIHL